MRLKSSHECRRCRRWLEGEWARAGKDTRMFGEVTPEQRDIQSQMDQGECWTCQSARLRAALDVIRRRDAVRVHEIVSGPGTAPREMLLAVVDAEDALTRSGLHGRQTRSTLAI